MSAALDRITEDLRKLQHEKRVLSKAVRTEAVRRQNKSRRMLRVATIAYCHEPAALTRYAEALIRTGRDVFTDDLDSVATQITSMFLATDTYTLSLWLEWEPSSCTKRDICDAQRLMRDANLLGWVESQNATQGLAPSQQFVWEHRCRVGLGRIESTDVSTMQGHTSAAAKKWMKRFRTRWSIHLGTLPVQEIVPVDMLRQKAR